MTTLKTYRAPTMAQALAEVKKDLGSAAIIVNTRSIRAGGFAGLGAKPIVEITASAAGPANPPQPRAGLPRPPAPVIRPAATPRPAITPTPTPTIRAVEPKPARAVAPVAKPEPDWTPLEFNRLLERQAQESATGAAARAEARAEPLPEHRAEMRPENRPEPRPEPRPELRADVRGEVSAEPRPEVRPAARAEPGPALIPAPPARVASLAVRAPLAPVSNEARASLEDELASIKRLMGQVLQFSRRAAARDGSQAAPPVGGVSPGLQDFYHQLLDSGLNPALADRLLAGAQAELEPAELADPDLVQRTLLRLLAESIPVVRTPARPGRQPDGRPLTIALVGPTGVGKTTTIAKLAAMYKLRHGKRVGLVTTDTYRIAAVEQLRTYARIIGLPLKVAADPQDLADGLGELNDLDVVLIDTAGRSPSDQARLDELSASVRAAAPHETHLVLAATAAEPVLLRTAERFRALGPDRLILTKLDEADQLGPIADLPGRLSLPVSYVSTGQEVPDDLELAGADRLARRIAPALMNDAVLAAAGV